MSNASIVGYAGQTAFAAKLHTFPHVTSALKALGGIPESPKAPFSSAYVSSLTAAYAIIGVYFLLLFLAFVLLHFVLDWLIHSSCCYGNPVKEYELDSDNADGEGKLRIGGPLGSSSLQLTPREGASSSDGVDEPGAGVSDGEMLENIDDDSDEYLHGDGDGEESVEVRHRQRRRWFMRFAVFFTLLAAVGLVALCVAGFVLNTKSSAAIEIVTTQINEAYSLYQKQMNASAFANTAVPLSQNYAASILNNPNYALPTDEQKKLTRIIISFDSLKGDTSAYTAELQRMNPVNSAALLTDANAVRSGLTISALVILLVVVLSLVISLAQCMFRIRIEHEPAKSGFFTCPRVSFACLVSTVFRTLVYLSLLVLAALSSFSIGFSIFMSDYCQDPTTWSQALYGIDQQTFRDTYRQRALGWYLACPNGGAQNPLSPLLAPITSNVSVIVTATQDLMYYANTQGSQDLKNAVGVLQGHVQSISESATAARARFDPCVPVHNNLYTSFNAACGPFLTYSAQLTFIMFFIVSALVLVRPCWNVVRFYRSHEVRARRFVSQIKTTESALGFSDTVPSMGAGAAPKAKARPASTSVAMVRPTLSAASNAKRLG